LYARIILPTDTRVPICGLFSSAAQFATIIESQNILALRDVNPYRYSCSK